MIWRRSSGACLRIRIRRASTRWFRTDRERSDSAGDGQPVLGQLELQRGWRHGARRTDNRRIPAGRIDLHHLAFRSLLPGSGGGRLFNQARATGDEGDEDGVADEDTVDLSDDGTDPDPGDGNDGPPNGDPGDADEDDPTEVEVQFSLESIPTLDEWGIVAMILLLAGTAIRRLMV